MRVLGGNTTISPFSWDFPSGSEGKESAYSVGDLGLMPGLGRSPGERNGCPLQYSCLENSMDRGAWWATAYGVTESDMTEQLTLSFLSSGDLPNPGIEPRSSSLQVYSLPAEP